MLPPRLSPEEILRILTVRDKKVMIDSDLAKLYGVQTKVFNQTIRRNRKRFPDDFAFLATLEDITNLRSQIVTSSLHGGRRTLPWLFTEHGAIMAATILNSPQAVQMSVYVVRAFMSQREQLLANTQLFKRLAEIDRSLIEHDDSLKIIWHKLQPLLKPEPEATKSKIGFWRDPKEASGRTEKQAMAAIAYPVIGDKVGKPARSRRRKLP